MVERGKFYYKPFGERSGSGQQGGTPQRGERVGIPIDIEARLAAMDAARGLPINIGTPSYRAPDIMDDRLNELATEIFERGDQASRDAIITLSLTYFLYEFHDLNTVKKNAYLQSYQRMRERHPEMTGYRITANEKRLFNSILKRGAAYTDFYGVVEPMAFDEDGKDIIQPLTSVDQLVDFIPLAAMDVWEDPAPKTTNNTITAMDEWIKRRGYSKHDFGALSYLIVPDGK